MTIKSLSAHFAISCVFRKRGELEDRAPSHTREATGRYELPAQSEAAVTETRCLQRCVDFADFVHCKTLNGKRRLDESGIHSPYKQLILEKIAKNKYPKAKEVLTNSMESCRK